MPRKKRGEWTDEKRAMAQEMRAVSMKLSVIAAALDLTVPAVCKELNGTAREEREATGRIHFEYARAENVPSEVFAERDARAIARLERDEALTSCGDLSFMIGDMPPPGRSALDRKRAGA
jgi:hypothetical protein